MLQKEIRNHFITVILFVLFNLSLGMVYNIINPFLEIGDYSYAGIGLFLISIFLAISSYNVVKDWLVVYISAVIIILYTVVLIWVIIDTKEWYNKALAILFLIPILIEVPRKVMGLVRRLF